LCICVFLPDLPDYRDDPFVAYHISSSLNWGLAAALGAILLSIVLVLYILYDKIVGIDNMKLG